VCYLCLIVERRASEVDASSAKHSPPLLLLSTILMNLNRKEGLEGDGREELLSHDSGL
jgi:hypothetical protein